MVDNLLLLAAQLVTSSGLSVLSCCSRCVPVSSRLQQYQLMSDEVTVCRCACGWYKNCAVHYTLHSYATTSTITMARSSCVVYCGQHVGHEVAQACDHALLVGV